MSNLFDQETATMPDPSSQEVPAYLLGADNHNIGNQGSSWFDPSTWGDRAGNALKFGAVSVLSGGAQLYNSGVAIGNWFGADAQESSIQDIVSSFDQDLGEYYSQNRQSADLVGFIASSFVPGLAGVKVLNAGQAVLKGAITTGKIGGNMARATGLLVPETSAYISAAAQDINAASATFSAISQNGIKALAAGAWQQTLEGAAFETMVQATMFKSPILEDQTTGDIIHNIVLGGALGGVVGGAFEAASTYGKIMQKVKSFELETKFSTARAMQQELSSPSLNVIRNAQDLETAATIIPPSATATADEIALYNTATKNIEHKIERTLNDMRLNTNALAKGADTSATNMVADAMVGMPSKGVMDGMLHADEITRPGVITSVEKDINKAVKAGTVDESLQVNYVKLTGENSGSVSHGEPLVLSIADSVGSSSTKSLADAVLEKVKGYKFKLGGLWDPANKLGTTAHTEAEARYIWASRLEKLPDELAIHQNDIPVLEKAWELGKLDLKLVDNSGQVIKAGFNSSDEMWKHIVDTKEAVANDLMIKKAFQGGEYDPLVSEAIGKIVNTKVSRLDGTAVKGDLEDYRAWQTTNAEYQAFKKSKNLPVSEDLDARFLPTYAKVSRRVPDMTDANGHVMDGATWIKTQEKIAQGAIDNVLAKATGELYSAIPTITEQQAWTANRGGAGAKLAGFATGGYGSLESIVAAYGSVTNKLKTTFRQTTSDTLQGPLANLGRNQEAAIEFSTINQKVTRSAKQWVRHTGDDGGEYLVTKEASNKLNSESAPVGIDEIEDAHKIGITNQETHQAIDAMIARSSNRTGTYQELRAAQGKVDAKDPAVFRPVRANPKDYPFFAFVKDDKVTGQGHTTMIFAADAAKLQQLGDKAEQAGYRVHYKSDTADFHKAYGDYEYQRTLNESYINSDLNNRGIYSETFTKTDPQKIINDIVQQHLREDDVLAMELMRAKNQKVFNFLEDQGKAYSRVESSTLGGRSVAALEKSGKNPYLDYIKTALDISKAPESQLLYSFNKFLDDSVSKAVGAVRDVWNSTRTPYDAEKINGILDRHGMNTGYRDAALDLLANHTAPKGELTKFVRAANGMLSTLTLGLDPLNALVNAVGANVLRGTELTQITDAIKKGNSQLAGDLAKLGKIDITGKGDLILSPTKLYAQAQKNFFEDAWKGQGELLKRYKAAGYVTGDIDKFHNVMDDFALKGTETVTDLNSRANRAFAAVKELGEKGKTLSGNKFSEEYNRFISADVMRQITDLAESHGILSREESHSYINTFVARVDGNTIASQRPLMFQGPLGNAVGLFQSYQFNMMQNLFRYSAEGSKKDVAMLMGLQGTFFGLNGLPAFQFINQHVVGTLSGNKNHVDLYDATYGAAGKQMGDLLMYGLPSDLLRTNLYSRGDINPRSVTVVPTNIKDIPFVSGFSNMIGNFKETVGKMANGADVWSSLLQGLEHNGISRPLAGMAQVLEATGPTGKVFSTTSKGSILFSNDLLSMASLTRLAGGRPLDEAIVNDGVFRIHSYQQFDHDKMNKLGEAVKASTIEGRVPDEGQVAQFAAEYAKSGGKQVQFNKWMLNKMKSANTNEAQKITSQLQNPFASKVQVLMGGDPYSE
jgi:hypothetical protein